MMIRRDFSIFTLAGVLAAVLVLQACGGGDEGFYDEFRPRAATAADLENKTFIFRDYSYGAVFDPSLSATSTTLAFEGAQANGSQHRIPFSITARAASSGGTASLEAGNLLLTFSRVDPSLPFVTTKSLSMMVTADVDDGRINLFNTETRIEQTSAPR